MKLLDAVEPVPTGPVRLTPEYLKAVARVENHPDNRSGSDKSWVWKALERDRQFFARVKRRSEE